MYSKALVPLICFVVSSIQALDWCDPELCPAGVKHTACGNTGVS